MTHLIEVLWFLCQFIAAYSWDRENFPAALCISWQDSDQCRGGITALSSNGVRLNTSIYFVQGGSSQMRRHSVSQWVEIHPGETAAIGYDGDMQLASVFSTGSQTSESISQLISPPNPLGNAVKEEYSMVQPEHGGG